MQNLREKLMKAGLVSQEQAKQAEADTSKRAERPRQEARPERRDERPRGERPRGDRPPPRDDRPPRRDDRRPPPKETFIRARPAAAPSASTPVIPKLPPLPGSKQHQRLESKKQLELDRKLRELVSQHQVAIEAGEQAFYFVTRKNRLRRMELSPTQAKQLETGELAVVERPEPASIEHSLVPSAIAEQMHALSQKSVRFLNRGEAPVGFISDDELKSRQAREAEQAASGETDAAEAAGSETAGSENAAERSETAAASDETSSAAAVAGEGTAAESGASEAAAAEPSEGSKDPSSQS